MPKRTAFSLLLAPMLGAAFVWGGYWIPPIELSVALSVPAIGALAMLLVPAGTRNRPSNALRCVLASAVFAGVWLALAMTPYFTRSHLLAREASLLPTWNREQPAFRFWVIANNQEDYRGTQIAREPLDKVEEFYRNGMGAGGWRLEERREAHGLLYLIFAKGHRKIAYHLGPAWDGRATTVEIFRVSFWPGADDPGSGRRVWHRWVRQWEESIRR